MSGRDYYMYAGSFLLLLVVPIPDPSVPYLTFGFPSRPLQPGTQQYHRIDFPHSPLLMSTTTTTTSKTMFNLQVLTPSRVTPPSLNRHQSYCSGQSFSEGAPMNATMYLARLRSRSTSPAPGAGVPRTAPTSSPQSSPPFEPPPTAHRSRWGWDDCRRERDPSRYISFPDFDELRDQQQYANRQ